MKIFTASGSIYEIEPLPSGYRIRRLVNGAPAEDNVRATEQWRHAIEITEPLIGVPILIVWCRRKKVLETTLTSNVVGITRDTQ